MIEEFLRITRPYPEPNLLVTVEGEVLAANPMAARLLSIESRPAAVSLRSLVLDPPDRLSNFLISCARSGSLLPGAVTVRGSGGEPERFRCEGASLRSSASGSPSLIMIRFRRQAEATHRFLLLNQKLEQLSKQIVERRRVEEELQAQALQLEETAAELELAVDELEDQKERALAAQADAERGASELAVLVERLEVLAAAGELLSASLDFRAALGDLATFCSSTFADYCVTYLLEDDGSLRRVGAAHADPGKAELMERLLHRPAFSSDLDQIPARVVRTGSPVLVDTVSDGLLRAAAEDDDHLAVLRRLAPRSSIVVPLRARDRIIGAIAVGTVVGGRRPFTELDLTLLEEIARRAALGIDNLRLLHVSQEANRAKADFLAVMSHELRTPLNAIVGYVDLLDAEVRGPVTDGQREQLRRIERNATHLISIIGEILEYARLEAGKEMVHAEAVELRALAREAAEAIEAVTIPRGLHFRLELPAVPVTTVTDAAKVRQILLNLLSNAVKFTEHGEVGLTLATRGDRAVFRVHDTGVGIDPNDVANVFEPFWQVQRGPTRSAGGTGLGLTITRRLALLLEGDITLESVPNEGSRFFFSLPLRAAEPSLGDAHRRSGLTRQLSS